MASIKITQLSDIGANLAANTLVPVVDMSGTPTTDKANLQIIGNLILNGAGGANFAPAANVRISNTSSNTQILINDANVLSGNVNLTFDKTTSTLSVPNVSSVGSFTITAGTGSGGKSWVFDGDGVLTWPGSGGASWTIGDTDANGWFEIGSTSAVTIQTDIANGASHFLFDVGGEFTAPGNVHVLGDVLTVGQGSDSVVLSAPVLIAGTNNPVYVQSAIYNFNSAGSSDLATYGADGNDSEAWTDMGFTGNTFNDPAYTITGPGDGYVFVQTYANGSLGGNLVLATGDNATIGDIIFATGGFALANDKARITGDGKLLVGQSASTDTSIVQVNGNISANNTILTGIVKTGVFTTSTLPAAATVGAGARAFVTDANSTTFAAAYVGGAANAMPVYSDGTSWYIG